MVLVKRYTPDFPAMMRLCEINYAQLHRLLPNVQAVGEFMQYQINDVVYQVMVIELTRYTTVAEIKQMQPLPESWGMPSMTVRLYHDARVAEVCASQQILHFKARYDYPNRKLHQRDEKHQVNQFLADWLRYCISQGVVRVSIL